MVIYQINYGNKLRVLDEIILYFRLLDSLELAIKSYIINDWL